MATLKDTTIASTYDLLVKRHETYIQTGTNIELMTDSSATVAPTGLYLESGATTSNVGIGVAAPEELLHIKGSGVVTAEIESTGGNAALRINANTAAGESSSSILYFDSSSSTAHEGSILYDHDATAASQKMQFLVADNAVTAMTLLGSGNVGIGTDSPNYGLHVS